MEKLSLTDVADDVSKAKAAAKLRRLTLKIDILTRWREALNATHIRECITHAQARDKDHCVLYTEQKDRSLSSWDYERLLRNTKVHDGKTVKQLILDQLEPGQFSVQSGMIGYGNFGNHGGGKFTETDFEIRLSWGFFDRHCIVQ